MGNTAPASFPTASETKTPQSTTPPQRPPNWAYFVLKFCDWPQRLALALICKGYAASARSQYHHQWICDRLYSESGVYAPSALPVGERWSSLSRELWLLRNLFVPSEQERLFRDTYLANEASRRYEELVSSESNSLPAVPSVPSTTDKFNIRVVARFRPPVVAADAAHDNADATKENQTAPVNSRTFVLPLHQRLQLIKIRDNVDSATALKTLKREGGWSVGRVDCQWKKRFLGASEGESKGHAKSDGVSMRAQVHTIDEGTGQVIVVAPAVGMRPFNFDFVLDERTSQSKTYSVAAKRLVMEFLNGYSTAAIMYGQTGSGKTFTMTGPPELGSNAMTSSSRGILPRVCEEVFHAVEKRSTLGVTCNLYVSYVEVFGDQVSDLLRGGVAVGHSKVSAQRFVMAGEAQKMVNSYDDISRYLSIGDAQKRRAATAMNERSSRAHSIFILSLHMLHEQTGVTLKPQFFLADLGGSEQVKRSKVHHGSSEQGIGFVLGQHMREAININSGLLALKGCITALNRGDSYIPFQNSKLTMLLSPALGGDSKAVVMVCASKEDANAQETLQALRFGENCSQVQNDARRKQSAIEQIIEAIDIEIKALEETIRSKERWESKEIVRKDALVEEGTYEAALAAERGGEVVRIGMIVGAETERERLEQLIRRRAKLTGENVDMRLAAAGFGGKYGGKADAMSGNAELRFKDHAQDDGLVMKGRRVAKWRA